MITNSTLVLSKNNQILEPITLTEANITIIIPVHKGGDSFRKCLSSLVQFVPVCTEIIVVVDGDDEDSWNIAQEFGTKVLMLSSNAGPARARNVGAHAATGDILFFIDADVLIAPKAIHKLLQAFNNEPNLAAVIGSYDDEPGASNFLSQYKNLFHHYTHQTASEEAFTFWGACGAMRREVFLSLGGFDESYRRPCIEDIELGYRLRRAGYQIRLCKDVQVKHLKRWGVVSLLRAEVFYRAIPWTQLIWRDRQLNNDLNLGVESRLSVILVFSLLSALIGASWWRGYLAIASIISLLLLIINAPVYSFFLKKCGFWFTIRVLPWHWFYYLYGGLAFALGTVQYLFLKWFSLKPKAPIQY
ncbi:MAG: glycosyltransferase [Scytonema sp. PMC 1069.18]|nr:glycosyltransferase [Scytonema sp. PMC 1069.18]MEC4881459.1 glycosyltransferase [Scytonema sp. PMC 1070.18]